MYKAIWGVLQSMRETQSKGNKVTVCYIEANGKWNEVSYQRDVQLLKVYYYDTPGVKDDATKCLERKFLEGQTVALVAKESDNPTVMFGRDLPTSHGFVKIPAAMKETNPNALAEFQAAFKACIKYKKLPPDYTVDFTKLGELITLYGVIGSSTDEIVERLRKATTALYWSEKYCFIGPIGGVFPVSGNRKRISVCPYHSKDTAAEWCDITLWDEEYAEKISKAKIGAGDVVYFDNLSKRSTYRGKQQYSGKRFHLIAKAGSKS